MSDLDWLSNALEAHFVSEFNLGLSLPNWLLLIWYGSICLVHHTHKIPKIQIHRLLRYCVGIANVIL